VAVTARQRGSSNDRGRAAAAHLWFAVLLFVALSLTTLQPLGEHDRWLGIGTVMLTVGLALWLPLRWLTPSVLLVWGLPFLVSRLVLDEPSETMFGSPALLQLAGLLFLGCGVSAMYRRVSEKRLQADESQSTQPVPIFDASRSHEAAALRTGRAQRRFPDLRLEPRDALRLYERLSRLRLELSETHGQLAVLIQNSGTD